MYKRQILTKTNYPIVVSQPYKINNKDICTGVDKVSCIVMVHTAPGHFERRVRMRATWLNSTYYSPESVRVVFLFGLVSNMALQFQIEKESEKFKDVVQGYFTDSYRNLTNKGVMGYKWISEHCRNAEFVAKIDDDAFINFFKLFEEMQYLKDKKRYILCNKINKGTMRIIRVNGSKWYVNEDEFRNMKAYPHTYCSGFSVFISIDLIPMLYRAAIGSPFFWVDDFFLFGLLPSQVPGVVHDNLRSNLSFMHPAAYDCYIRYRKKCKYLIVPAKEKEIPKMWLAVVQDRTQSIFGNYYMDLPSLPERSTPRPMS
jgi:beta-1,3-galactosyltransferase 1